MKITLSRYFGNRNITKSILAVTDSDGRELMRCEAREPRYADYRKTFSGCSQFCLAEGTYPCKPLPTDQCPMTLTVVKSPGHRCCRFAWSESGQKMENRILVGEADDTFPADIRKLHRQRETFGRLTRLVYEAFAMEEAITLEVRNENVQTA